MEQKTSSCLRHATCIHLLKTLKADIRKIALQEGHRSTSSWIEMTLLEAVNKRKAAQSPKI